MKIDQEMTELSAFFAEEIHSENTAKMVFSEKII